MRTRTLQLTLTFACLGGCADDDANPLARTYTATNATGTCDGTRESWVPGSDGPTHSFSEVSSTTIASVSFQGTIMPDYATEVVVEFDACHNAAVALSYSADAGWSSAVSVFAVPGDQGDNPARALVPPAEYTLTIQTDAADGLAGMQFALLQPQSADWGGASMHGINAVDTLVFAIDFATE